MCTARIADTAALVVTHLSLRADNVLTDFGNGADAVETPSADGALSRAARGIIEAAPTLALLAGRADHALALVQTASIDTGHATRTLHSEAGIRPLHHAGTLVADSPRRARHPGADRIGDAFTGCVACSTEATRCSLCGARVHASKVWIAKARTGTISQITLPVQAQLIFSAHDCQGAAGGIGRASALIRRQAPVSGGTSLGE